MTVRIHDVVGEVLFSECVLVSFALFATGSLPGDRLLRLSALISLGVSCVLLKKRDLPMSRCAILHLGIDGINNKMVYILYFIGLSIYPSGVRAPSS